MAKAAPTIKLKVKDDELTVSVAQGTKKIDLVSMPDGDEARAQVDHLAEVLGQLGDSNIYTPMRIEEEGKSQSEDEA